MTWRWWETLMVGAALGLALAVPLLLHLWATNA